MKQFDVCPVKPANASTKKAQWVLVLQHNQADTPDMVVVAPFYDPAAMPPVRGMRLAMTVGKRQQVLAVDQLGAVARSVFGPAVATISEDQEDAVRKALDLIFAGF
jgi:mRNA-degrading endonuclease toxin of MazEF toxin-antitoxin module